MAMGFTRLCWWAWGGKEHGPTTAGALNSTVPKSSDSEMGFREPEQVKFHTAKGHKLGSSSVRRTKKKWKSRAEKREVEREYDIVLVPSDGGSDAEDPDWSIGWLEPLASDFQRDDEKDSSFAVLVRCYGGGYSEQLVENSRITNILTTVDGYSSDGRKNAGKLLSFLQSS